MTRTIRQTIPFGADKLYYDALYFHLIHKGYKPKQAEKEVTIRLNAKIRQDNENIKYSEKLREQLEILEDDSIILVETSPEKAFEIGLIVIKYYSDKKDTGIIVSACRPYSNLVNVFKKRYINIRKMFVLDCISKNQNADLKAENAVFIENISALTEISISINHSIKKINGTKKFILFDSIPTMIINNKPYIFARFIHSVLTELRLNRISGILVSYYEENNKELRAEIVQMCDKVIKI